MISDMNGWREITADTKDTDAGSVELDILQDDGTIFGDCWTAVTGNWLGVAKRLGARHWRPRGMEGGPADRDERSSAAQMRSALAHLRRLQARARECAKAWSKVFALPLPRNFRIDFEDDDYGRVKFVVFGERTERSYSPKYEDAWEPSYFLEPWPYVLESEDTAVFYCRSFSVSVDTFLRGNFDQSWRECKEAKERAQAARDRQEKITKLKVELGKLEEKQHEHI